MINVRTLIKHPSESYFNFIQKIGIALLVLEGQIKFNSKHYVSVKLEVEELPSDGHYEVICDDWVEKEN